MEIDDKILEALKHARTSLAVASSIISLSASDVKPWRASKFLNILGKEVGQLRWELEILMDEHDISEYPDLYKKMPSFRILQLVKKEEKEVKTTG